MYSDACESLYAKSHLSLEVSSDLDVFSEVSELAEGFFDEDKDDDL